MTLGPVQVISKNTGKNRNSRHFLWKYRKKQEANLNKGKYRKYRKIKERQDPWNCFVRYVIHRSVPPPQMFYTALSEEISYWMVTFYKHMITHYRIMNTDLLIYLIAYTCIYIYTHIFSHHLECGIHQPEPIPGEVFSINDTPGSYRTYNFLLTIGFCQRRYIYNATSLWWGSHNAA